MTEMHAPPRRWTPNSTPANGRITPWDIGGPQPALVELEDTGRIGGEVLDAGCGLGDNAIFLASRGHRVTAVDAAPRAIREARDRARARAVEVGWAVTDVTVLAGFHDRFDTVVDSALYHCLTEEERRRYIAALHRACRPGARLHLFCFAQERPAPFPVRYRISEENLRDTLDGRWRITALELTWYRTSLTLDSVRQMTGADPAGSPDADRWTEFDEHGRIKAPVWQLAAERVDQPIR